MKRSFANTIVMVSVYSIALIMSALIVATPSRAFASDGFLAGLQDLVGAREIEPVQDYEGAYLEGYDPQLRLDPPDPGTNTLTVIDEDSTTVDYVNFTLDSFNKVNWGNTDRTLIAALRLFLTNWTLFIPAAVGLVFMWWGVRKTIQMLMSGFRKGSMNV